MGRAWWGASALLSLLLAGFAFGHRTEPPGPEPLPAIDIPQPISVLRPLRLEPLSEEERAEGERVLRTFRLRWSWVRNRLPSECGDEPFDGQACQPELRLWVRGYPEIAYAWAGQALKRVDYLGEDAGWAFDALVELAAVRYPRAEERLLEVCRAPAYRELAPGGLLAARLEDQAIPQLRRLGWSNIEEAWHVLSHLGPRPELLALEGATSRLTRLAVARAKAFQAGTWEPLARTVITLDESSYDEDFPWALRVAQDRKVIWLPGLLRRALDASSSGSERYDRMLLTLAECGGPLNARERAYLRRYGYGCEPRARLAEVLREKGY
jgi:hypothetical protein